MGKSDTKLDATWAVAPADALTYEQKDALIRRVFKGEDPESMLSTLVEALHSLIDLAIVEHAVLALQRVAPEGWMLVPVVPTNRMIGAGGAAAKPVEPNPWAIYSAMLAAAPDAPVQASAAKD